MSNIDNITSIKICTVCKEEKFITEFNSNKNSKDGHLGKCKKCVKYIRDKNKEKRKVYLEITKENRRITQRSYYEENKEKLNIKCKAYYKTNKEHLNAVNKAWTDANKYRCAAQQKAWRDANKERCASNKKAWCEANPEKHSATKRNNVRHRRAIKRNASGNHTIADVLNLLVLQKNKCVCCLKSIKNGYHVDHIIPLSRGGSNDKYNLQLLCAPCNLSKHAKDPIEFNQSLGMLL